MKPQGKDVYPRGGLSTRGRVTGHSAVSRQTKCFPHWPSDHPHLLEFWNSRQKLDKNVTQNEFIIVLQDFRVPQKCTHDER